jgi:hypothetical protein
MTIYEAGGLLYEWFSENDSYNPDEDYKKLVLVSENPEEDRAAILCSLDSFVEASVVKKKEMEGKEYWILTKKFSATEQDILITAQTALSIHSYVRMYVDNTGLQDDYECDPLNISEKDLQILMSAIKILSNK